MSTLENKKKLYRLAYLSRAQKHFTQEMVDNLEEQSSQNNAQLGITGYVCYTAPLFFAYMEGGEAEILQQMRQIQNDLRHDVISIIDLDTADERLFTNWGLIIDVADVQAYPGLRHMLAGMQKFIHGDDQLRSLVMQTVTMVAGHHELIGDIANEQEFERVAMRMRTSAMTA